MSRRTKGDPADLAGAVLAFLIVGLVELLLGGLGMMVLVDALGGSLGYWRAVTAAAALSLTLAMTFHPVDRKR